MSAPWSALQMRCRAGDRMPDEGPLIFRVSMGADEERATFSHGFDCVWYLLDGAERKWIAILTSPAESFSALMRM